MRTTSHDSKIYSVRSRAAQRSTAFSTLVIVSVLSAGLISGCATGGRLATRSGRPEILVPRSALRYAPVAITSYNINKGRELDQAKANELITYDGVRSNSGDVQVTAKTIYQFVPEGDSVMITSTRMLTTDLDDESADEDAAQPSLELQQQELTEIGARLVKQTELHADDVTQQ